ncbi:HsdR family type I site-specific deoxyribonuclease [Leptospira levettii]|uniref:type I restriction endonuclease subunit R n=1 Tax=Leptospira levettii TaxID=2023178 RepID=UPI00108460BB|nr:HsdR family type I site-specific deoxyribonuclease [Leptospira levettii]TGM66440.1 HsdR family type I site-specific deoxyribonuclease [Leptospira levettii]
MEFNKESDFENAVIEALSQKGWGEEKVINFPTEEELIQNWADILFQNNRVTDRLNEIPLTNGEMQQILEQIKKLRNPLNLNGFINGKTVSIKRDNPEDKLHFGKEVSLKIYDRQEIAAGQSRYQIVIQPKFKATEKILNYRRGDLMLLINGMPVIHIELKKSGVSVSQAYHQIEKYSKEGIFTGLFSLVQVFVAMQPEETVYFANPGMDGKFNKDYYFHWADFNNEPINDWKNVVSSLLSIPMAHQLIGFYTVADDADGILKVMRSYQYYAANAISDRVAKRDWKEKKQLGGFVWHTTGSGKTMTSFKSAQLISNSKNADKVIFLMDRIELGTQSLKEYRNFADETDEIQSTENTIELVIKLKSTNPADTLIVTSIQKMSNIKEEGSFNSHDIEIMSNKRIVFIVDEAHRSTFGDMLIDIKNTFPGAMFFGFTGTPIHEENSKKENSTIDIFGDELQRYSIADGIRDKNVLGFDPYKILTYKDKDLRKALALKETNSKDEKEALSDPDKKKVFNHYMNQLKMAGEEDSNGKYVKGIEDYLLPSQYQRKEHYEKVIEDILDNWITLSQNHKYHAIFATSSIKEAINYYRLLKSKNPEFHFTALFDPNIDNNEGAFMKEEGLVEIMKDYNDLFGMDFSFATHDKFKKDIAARLAHKSPYTRIESTPEKQIHLLIVVDQMLTGFDSKWINTLYLDKVLLYENIIQAFSRTNRLFGPDKPFGTVRYYRFPHTMEQYINKAVKLYSGDRPLGLFVEKLSQNLKQINFKISEITQLFESAGVSNFEKLPSNTPERGMFAKHFKELNSYLEAAKIQGFVWEKSIYEIRDESGKVTSKIEMDLDKNLYLTLANRYKELTKDKGEGGDKIPDVPFEIDGYLTTIDTEDIDAEYMNSRFDKYLKMLKMDGIDEKELQKTLDEVHKSFASLTQEQQKYANLFLHDIQRGDVIVGEGKTLREYITLYQSNAKNDQIKTIVRIFSLDESKLRALMASNISEANINEYGRFDQLKDTVDKAKAKVYFEKLEGENIPLFKLNMRIHEVLKNFVIKGVFEFES